ncbi:uncharacterized protein NPIL_449581 [Nephila pilipes]|uniref:Endonuclease/exonuclease/phosphatase domain-containing protein n=1 Tax=Nephila pilipes TaxID=299642 RepID=A0A8X6NA90_NEPPI|nr:uncharacterized protein NPIL_449581 [Nephila pilipes]
MSWFSLLIRTIFSPSQVLLIASSWREGVPGQNGRSALGVRSWEGHPRREGHSLFVQLKSADIGAKTDFYHLVPDPWINRSCTFPPSYELIDSQFRCCIVRRADKSEARSRFRKRASFAKPDRPSRGGGLAFFIRDVKYQSIDFSLDQSSDLEIEGFKIFWRGKPLHILNAYLLPYQSHLPINFSNFMDKNTIILGDLNAKHIIWGSSCNNDRGEDILQMTDDKEFMILNDGSPSR